MQPGPWRAEQTSLAVVRWQEAGTYLDPWTLTGMECLVVVDNFQNIWVISDRKSCRAFTFQCSPRIRVSYIGLNLNISTTPTVDGAHTDTNMSWAINLSGEKTPDLAKPDTWTFNSESGYIGMNSLLPPTTPSPFTDWKCWCSKFPFHFLAVSVPTQNGASDFVRLPLSECCYSAVTEKQTLLLAPHFKALTEGVTLHENVGRTGRERECDKEDLCCIKQPPIPYWSTSVWKHSLWPSGRPCWSLSMLSTVYRQGSHLLTS